MNALVVSSMLSKNNLISICAPKSLRTWLQNNNITYNHSKNCDVSIKEVRLKRLI